MSRSNRSAWDSIDFGSMGIYNKMIRGKKFESGLSQFQQNIRIKDILTDPLLQASLDEPINIMAIEGSHGVGKTTIINELEKQGYYVLQEGFLDTEHVSQLEDKDSKTKPIDALSILYKDIYTFGHTFAIELQWVGKMFEKLYNLIIEIRKGNIKLKDNIIITDRSWITPLVYGDLSYLGISSFANICTMLINQLEIFNVNYQIIKLYRNDKEIQFGEILKRIIREPFRKALNEESYQWLLTIESKYRSLGLLINHIIKLDPHYFTPIETEVEQVKEELVLLSQKKIWEFQRDKVIDECIYEITKVESQKTLKQFIRNKDEEQSDNTSISEDNELNEEE